MVCRQPPFTPTQHPLQPLPADGAPGSRCRKGGRGPAFRTHPLLLLSLADPRPGRNLRAIPGSVSPGTMGSSSVEYQAHQGRAKADDPLSCACSLPPQCASLGASAVPHPLHVPLAVPHSFSMIKQTWVVYAVSLFLKSRTCLRYGALECI